MQKKVNDQSLDPFGCWVYHVAKHWPNIERTLEVIMAMEGAEPYKVNYIDLRGGRKSEDFQPIGVKVENTPGNSSLVRKHSATLDA